jgi:hypothetical protein
MPSDVFWMIAKTIAMLMDSDIVQRLVRCLHCHVIGPATGQAAIRVTTCETAPCGLDMVPWVGDPFAPCLGLGQYDVRKAAQKTASIVIPIS